MKKLKLILLAIPMMAALQFCLLSNATGQTVHQGWSNLGESSDFIDVSFQVVKCSPNSANEIHLQIVNEKPEADNVKFDLLITNPATSKSFKVSVAKLVALASVVQPDCSADRANSNLKIPLPAGYDPAAVTVAITFLP